MSPGVERVAKVMRELAIDSGEGGEHRIFDLLGFSGENQAHIVVNALALAAMRETRLIDAEAAQALVNDGTFGPGAERDTAQGFVDWLKGRADAE